MNRTVIIKVEDNDTDQCHFELMSKGKPMDERFVDDIMGMLWQYKCEHFDMVCNDCRDELDHCHV